MKQRMRQENFHSYISKTMTTKTTGGATKGEDSEARLRDLRLKPRFAKQFGTKTIQLFSLIFLFSEASL